MTRPNGDGALATGTVERVLDLIGGHPELNEFKYTKIPADPRARTHPPVAPLRWRVCHSVGKATTPARNGRMTYGTRKVTGRAVVSRLTTLGAGCGCCWPRWP